jgi:hypothetical protein
MSRARTVWEEGREPGDEPVRAERIAVGDQLRLGAEPVRDPVGHLLLLAEVFAADRSDFALAKLFAGSD